MKMILEYMGYNLTFDKIKKMLNTQKSNGTAIDEKKLKKFSVKLYENNIPLVTILKYHNTKQGAIKYVTKQLQNNPICLIYDHMVYTRHKSCDLWHCMVCTNMDSINRKIIGNDPMKSMGKDYVYNWSDFTDAWEATDYICISFASSDNPLPKTDKRKYNKLIDKIYYGQTVLEGD